MTKNCPMCHKKLIRSKDGYRCRKKNCNFSTGKHPIFGYWGDILIDSTDTEMNIVESAKQMISFRVGPVFGLKGIFRKFGIWIAYQEKYHASPRMGELLISKETWDEIVRQVNRAFKENSRRLVKR